MNIDPTHNAVPAAARSVLESTSGGGDSLKETAQQFEEIFIRQFVQVMTRDLFKNSLAGEQSEGWIGQQAELQADVLTDVLTRHLAERGTFNVAESLLKQWRLQESLEIKASPPTSDSD